MDNKLLVNFDKYTLALYNYKLFERYKSIIDNLQQPSADLLNITEIFDFINTNFEKLRTSSNLIEFLPILHYTILLETPNTVYGVTEKYIEHFLRKYSDSDTDKQIVFMLLYQILKSLNQDNDAQFTMLLNFVIELFYNTSSKKTRTSILVCIKLFIQKFNQKQILNKLWEKIMQSQILHTAYNTEILVQLIDELILNINNLYKNTHIAEIVGKLLLSDNKEDRKSAIYIIKKLVREIVKSYNQSSEWELDRSSEIQNSWSSYITIFENLEENQSHLILPSLEMLQNIKLRQHWIDKLLVQMLAHSNSLVLRWSIEYILKAYNAAQLSDEVLTQFIKATNNTNLFNYDNYFLPKQDVPKFLEGNVCKILMFFPTVNWHPVPIHFWFSELQKIKNISHVLRNIDTELLLTLSVKIRNLSNRIIRDDLKKIFDRIFAKKVKDMSLKDYLTYVEKLYNETDYFGTYSIMSEKIMKCPNPSAELRMSHGLYLILTPTLHKAPEAFKNLLMETYSKIPAELHGYFRLIVALEPDFDSKQMLFCSEHYDLEIPDNFKNFTLAQLNNTFQSLITNKTDEVIVREKVVNLFVDSLESIDQLECFEISIESLMDTTSCVKTLHKLTELLASSGKEADIVVLDRLVDELKKHLKSKFPYVQIASNILAYAGNHRDVYAVKILNLDLENKNLCYFALQHIDYRDDFKDIFMRGILLGEPMTGDQRVEQIYCFEKGLSKGLSTEAIRTRYRAHISFNRINFGEYYVKMCNYLIDKSCDLSKNQTRYYDNTLLHRLKLRIAIAIANNCRRYGKSLYSTRFWIPVLEENNQMNVTHIFERIIAYTVTNSDLLLPYLEKVSTCSPSQQVSIMTVSYMYCLLNKDKVFATRLISILHPLTMGANFTTRLHAQLVIYNLIKKVELDKSTRAADIRSPFHAIRDAICTTLGNQLDTLSQDIRFIVKNKTFLRTDIILYVTNAPFDEYNKSAITKAEIHEFRSSKEFFAKKTCSKKKTASNVPMEVEDVQRKMNPPCLTNLECGLISYPEWKNEEINNNNMIVVASLIDKLPNLGGIARTCEVLGIKNLILESIKHVDHNDFRNVSMTAEKGLKISEVKPALLLEFLLQKRSEGYQIVGAEQTAKSESFTNFTFPKKCILLLGHEKEGIPSNLISFLDYAVEIPQFGMVRSLNVHVTAALFIWEYCKQHIVGGS